MKKHLAGAAAALVLLAGPLAAPVSAAAWNPISGTVYSPCSSKGWVWYISQNQRQKAGAGDIKVQFTAINPGGLNFKIVDQANVTIGSNKTFGPNETDIAKVLAQSVANGRRFYNAFKELDGKCGYANYSFTGSELY